MPEKSCPNQHSSNNVNIKSIGPRLSSHKKTWGIFIGLLLLNIIIRSLLSIHHRIAYIYTDELLYYELAQNIWLKGSLSVYNTSVNFTKLLYPALLSPFFSISNVNFRLTAIGIFNAVLSSSALIPMFLATRRMIKSDALIIAILIIMSFSPNLLFCSTFMSENLYYPLLMWVFFCIIKMSEKGSKKVRYAIVCGFLTALLYFTKEAGIAIFVSLLLTLLFLFLQSAKKDKPEIVKSLFSFLACFSIAFFPVRYVLLSHIGYTYRTQAYLGSLLSPARLLFFIYSSIMMMLYFSVSGFSIPLFASSIVLKSEEKTVRSFFLASFSYMVLIAAGIAYGVSLYDDMGNADLRIHLRYFAGALFPFLLILSHCWENNETPPCIKRLQKLSLFYALLSILLLRVPRFGSPVDSPVFHVFTRFPRTISGHLLFLLIMIGGSGLILFLLRRAVTPKTIAVFSALLLSFEAINGICFYRQLRNEQTDSDPALVSQVSVLNDFFDQRDGKIAVVQEKEQSQSLKTFNTYFDHDFYLLLNEDLLMESTDSADSSINLQTMQFPSHLGRFGSDETQSIDQINYVIADATVPIVNSSDYEDITPANVTSFLVYKSDDPSQIKMHPKNTYTLGSEIGFYAARKNYLLYNPTGFSEVEESFTWTEGNSVSVRIKPYVSSPVRLKATVSYSMTIGEQYCQVYAGEQIVFEQRLEEGSGVLSFIVPESSYAPDQSITLRFELPDAREPGNGDKRILALAFHSIVLESSDE